MLALGSGIQAIHSGEARYWLGQWALYIYNDPEQLDLCAKGPIRPRVLRTALCASAFCSEDGGPERMYAGLFFCCVG